MSGTEARLHNSWNQLVKSKFNPFTLLYSHFIPLTSFSQLHSPLLYSVIYIHTIIPPFLRNYILPSEFPTSTKFPEIFYHRAGVRYTQRINCYREPKYRGRGHQVVCLSKLYTPKSGKSKP